MAINQLSTANTFQQWLVATQSLIGVANNLTDGGTSQTFYANTNLFIGGDLTVSGNITLDAVGYDNLNVASDLYVGGEFTGAANTAIYANISLTQSSVTSAFNTANNSYDTANAAFTAANTSSSDALAFAIALG